MKNFGLLKKYVEGIIDLEQLQDELAKNKDLEKFLDNLEPTPPYSSFSVSAYHYLIALDSKNLGDCLDAHDFLKKILDMFSIDYNESKKLEEEYSLMLSVQPKWLDMRDDEFSALMEKAGDKYGKDLVNWLKVKIKEKYKYINKPPKWIQSPMWPIKNGLPLVFLGQLSMGELLHDNSQVYVFYDQKNNIINTVIQSM